MGFNYKVSARINNHGMVQLRRTVEVRNRTGDPVYKVMSSKTTKQPWRKYDAGFKAQVLNKVQNGQSVPEVAKELGISEGIIYHWKSKSNTNRSMKDDSRVSELEREVAQLKQQLRQAETEGDILKKAALIFAKPT
jgi:transposase